MTQDIIEIAEQRAAAREHNALVDDIGRQFRRYVSNAAVFNPDVVFA